MQLPAARLLGSLAATLPALFGSMTSVVADSPVQDAIARAHRILFLGDSITYSGQYVEYFEAGLRLTDKHWKGEVFNLGLPSETVSGLSEAGHAGGQFPRPDLHERLDRILSRVRPDLIMACYGMNDGIYQPFSENRFTAFREGLLKLRKQAQGAGCVVVHLTPPTYDPVAAHPNQPPTFDYNTVLDQYTDWLLQQRKAGWLVVDIHSPMNEYLSTRRKQDPAYTLAGDGVHAGETGHWLMAKCLLACLETSPELAKAESAQAWLALRPPGLELLSLVQQRQRMLKDAWLAETGHKRPGMNKGLPVAEAQEKAAAIRVRIETLLRQP